MRSARIAPIVYVTAWAAGLLAAPAAPPVTAPDAEFTTYLDVHGARALVQSLLVHGVAGLALAAVVVGAAAIATTPSARAALLVTGLGAAAVSLLQVGLMALAVAVHRDAAAWFEAINLADCAKLLLLAGFAAGVRAGTPLRGRSVRLLAPLVVVVLPVSALAFPLHSTALYGLLYLALPLLLLFVVALGRALPRGQ